MSDECPHARVTEGLCDDCGQCAHDVILNGVCYRCGARDVVATVAPGSDVVPADRLKKRRS